MRAWKRLYIEVSQDSDKGFRQTDKIFCFNIKLIFKLCVTDGLNEDWVRTSTINGDGTSLYDAIRCCFEKMSNGYVRWDICLSGKDNEIPFYSELTDIESNQLEVICPNQLKEILDNILQDILKKCLPNG